MEENTVGLVGEMVELEPIKNICGFAYTGYRMKIATPRLNGTMDELIVIFNEESADYSTFGEDNSIDYGSLILVQGHIQSLKDFGTGKVLVFILADYMGVVNEQAELDNYVHLEGEIAKPIIGRETPKGKHIAEVTVKTPSLLHSASCYIPCICWQEAADKVADWQEGERVTIEGRLQSRIYVKRNGDEVEEHTAYELSAKNITKESEG